MTLTPFYFFILGLACWRLASLLANEAGAFHMFKHIRRYAARLSKHNRFWRAFHLYEGCTCEWCNSVWFGGSLFFLWRTFGDVVVLASVPLALSAVAILMKYVIQAVQQIDEHFDHLNKPYRDGEEYRPVQIPEHSFLMEDLQIK